MILPIPLNEMIKQQKIPSALLFVGSYENCKKIALDFAKEVLQETIKIEAGSHPDVHHYYPEGKAALHSIESMRDLSNQVALKSFEGKWKFFIIHEADRMLPTSSNALLKTIEEPSIHTSIILLCSQQERLLPTIISRCQILTFQTLASGKSYESEKRLQSLLQIIPVPFSTLSKAIDEIAQEVEKERTPMGPPYERENALLERILLHFRDLSLKNDSFSYSYVHKEISKARLALERSMKLSSVLEALFIKLF